MIPFAVVFGSISDGPDPFWFGEGANGDYRGYGPAGSGRRSSRTTGNDDDDHEGMGHYAYYTIGDEGH